VTFRELVAQAGGAGVPVADEGVAVTVTVVVPAAGAVEALAGLAGAVGELDEDAQPATAVMQISAATAQPAGELSAPEPTYRVLSRRPAPCARLSNYDRLGRVAGCVTVR
jgi:hypothetical protein